MKIFGGLLLAGFAFAAISGAQPRGGGPQPEFVRQAQQAVRAGKLEDALDIYRKELQSNPNSPEAASGAGQVLDLMGKGVEARTYLQKAIDNAPNADRKAAAERVMAMSYAFEGDCKNTVKYEQMVFDHYVAAKDFYQQGEMANEAARVCIDAGDLDTAAKWYRIGHDAGLKQPDITPARKALWEFRMEHALARIAARRGQKAEAEQHVARAKAALDEMAKSDESLANQQRAFFPYLTGYVAYYTGDYRKALADLQQANQNDPFIQCLIGMTYEKLGDRAKATEAYQKASQATAHNPPSAFARPFARKKLGA